MKDTDLFAQLLGIVAPWRVSSVKLETDDRKVNIYLDHDKDVRFDCPMCGVSAGVDRHSRRKTWVHLDACQFQTFLHASIPIIRCHQHGLQWVKVPWARDKNLPKPSVPHPWEENTYFGELAENTVSNVRIWFDSCVAHQIIGRRWSSNQNIENCSDGGIILTLESVQLDKVVSWVLGFGLCARMLEPNELLQRVCMARWGKCCANEDIATEAVGILENLWQSYADSIVCWDPGDLESWLESGHIVGIGQGRASGPKRDIKAAELALADLARYENALDPGYMIVCIYHNAWQDDDNLEETLERLQVRERESECFIHYVLSPYIGKYYEVMLIAISKK